MEVILRNLSGKTAVVTGGSRGYGKGIVEALASQGMRVIVVARREDSLAALKREVSGNITTIAGNITDPLLAARVLAENCPDVLVLNAGARGISRPTRFQTWESFSVQIETDLKGTFLWAREALLLPLKEDSTIFIGSSGAAMASQRLIAGYAAAKAAQWAFARCLADEGKALGLHVHCLLPIMSAETEMGKEGMQDFARHFSEEEMASRRNSDQGKVLTPSFLGRAVLDILGRPTNSTSVGFVVTGSEIQPMNAM